MARAAQRVEGVDFLDLYAAYPRLNINVAAEQKRLLTHDILILQFPLFWYSTPAILKEWQDLVLEHGFAYGAGGTALKGKSLLLAVTAAGGADAYTPEGYQRHPMRDFLIPLEQTAHLCSMHFLPPYVLYGALRAPQEGTVPAHVAGYTRLLTALRDDHLDLDAVAEKDVLTHTDSLLSP